MATQVHPEHGPFPGKLGPHTALAIERLKKGEPGDTVQPYQMAEIIGRPCHHSDPGYGNVNTAIRHVEANHGIVWRWDRTLKAWRCLHDGEKSAVQRGELGSARRRARRALKVGATVDRDKLSTSDRLDHDVNMSTAGMVFLASHGRFRKHIEATITEGGKLQEPNMVKLIELMKC